MRLRNVLLGAALLPIWYGVQAQQVQVSPANRTISITTTQTAERRADTATLHVGYLVYAPDSAGAYAAGAAISQAVAAALAKAGAAKDAVSSESQSTGPVQEYQNQSLSPTERAQRRFQAQQSWTVKTTPAAVAQLLAEAVAAGANESGQVEWTVADEDGLVAEAQLKALSHAREQASRMASGMGAKVGSLLYASNEVERVRPLPMMAARAADQSQSKAAPRLSLSAPLVTRSATVAAIFAVE